MSTSGRKSSRRLPHTKAAGRRKTRAGRPRLGRPSAEDARDVRADLLETARRLFVERGFGEVGIRELAREAGVTPAMIHYYFQGKEGLQHAMLEDSISRVLGRAREVAESTSDRSDVVKRLVTVLVEEFLAEPWVPTFVMRYVMLATGPFRDRFIERYASQIAELVPFLMRNEQAGRRLRADLDPRLAAVSLLSMTIHPFIARGLIEQAVGVHFDASIKDRFIEHTCRLFLEGAQAR